MSRARIQAIADARREAATAQPANAPAGWLTLLVAQTTNVSRPGHHADACGVGCPAKVGACPQSRHAGINHMHPASVPGAGRSTTARLARHSCRAAAARLPLRDMRSSRHMAGLTT